MQELLHPWTKRTLEPITCGRTALLGMTDAVVSRELVADATPGQGRQWVARQGCAATGIGDLRRGIRAAARNKCPKIAKDMAPDSRRGKGRIAWTM